MSTMLGIYDFEVCNREVMFLAFNRDIWVRAKPESSDARTCTDSVYELQCDNGKCVPRSVRCDYFNNCDDGSDQRVGAPSYCPYRRKETTSAGTYIWWIILALIGGYLLSYILYWLCWRPGYIPWRLACCRNFCKQCFVGCCRTCCSKCKCRGCLRRFGRTCRRCCQGRKARSKNQNGSEESFIRNDQKNRGKEGGKEGDWAGMSLITRSGKGRDKQHDENIGAMFGDHDYFNGDGGHVRESR
ncbi:uncharacterized protein LOC117117387 [Anneissia japonica]|uniref:uncharacterized protein LOC117117387 n=1 Tax=Anneissia japonica TaxID=1529436 RepID=UPI0014258E87|nr:uncharacterized protein LOC117117387 [Anneissia japonica]